MTTSFQEFLLISFSVCGTGIDYCEGPDCQLDYGPACDGNQVPPGPVTSNIPRPNLGSVPYGTRINDCTKPGVVALTFDDGPYIYTSDLLDILDQYNAKVTFFISELFTSNLEEIPCSFPLSWQQYRQGTDQ
jgi:Polysaccharide deacetylase